MKKIVAITLKVTVLLSMWLFPVEQTYAADTVIFITDTSATTWAVPSDWNNSANTIEVIGGGGGGHNAYGTSGGGGAYAKVTNISLVPSTNVALQVGTGGSEGVSGEDTYFCDSASNCADITGVAVQVGAKGGASGNAGGAGGAAASSVGTTKYNGGSSAAYTSGTPGSGGAGGPHGAGGNGGGEGACGGGGGGGAGGGTDGQVGGGCGSGLGGDGGNNYASLGSGAGGSGFNQPGSNGSNGGGGGGGGSAATAGNGGDGQDWDGTHGSGGGGGAGGINGGNGGNGGLYGGGGGTSYGQTSGTGAQGIIVVTYTPLIRSTLSRPINNLGLIGYFSFNEGSGTKAGDFSGNNVSGTFTNSPDWVNGKNGKALSFDGNADNVYFTGSTFNFSIASGDGMTVSAWVKTSDDLGQVISFRNGNDPQPVLDLSVGFNGITTNLGHFLPLMRYDAGGGLLDVSASMRIDDGQWHHVAAVVDQANNLLKAYVDGVEYSVAQATDGVLTFGNGEIAVAHELNWTNNAVNDTDKRYLEGTVDEVRVYNRALSANEVKTLAQSKIRSIGGSEKNKVTSGLVGHWTFNGNDMNWTSATAGTAYDRSGQGNDGTINGLSQSTSPVQGKVGQGLLFDGTGDYIRMTDSASLKPSTEVTIAAWIKVEDPTAQQVIFDHVSASPYYGYGCSILTSKIYCDIAYNANATEPLTDASITAGRWTHFVATFDGARLKYYMDGVLDTDVSTSGTITYTATQDPTIGVRDIDYSSLGFRGSMDDIRIYNRALTASEVKQLYQIGAGTVIKRN